MGKDGSVQDAVMEASKLRNLLKLARAPDEEGGSGRLPIVFGVDNGDVPVLFMARRGNPRTLRASVAKTVQMAGLSGQIKAGGAQLYFGYAYTSVEAPGTLRIDANKRPAGADKLAMKMARVVRSAGFDEVVFQLDEGLETDAGEDPSDSTAAPSAPLSDRPAMTTVDIWNEAKAAADAQLGQLYTLLKSTGHPVLIETADEIEAVLEKFRVGVVASLMSYDGATGSTREASRVKAMKLVSDAMTRLASDAHVDVADTNPFGVQVTTRVILGGALTRLAALLAVPAAL